jgi:hypothetical protein
MKDKYKKLYGEANRIIGNKTPLKKDCGQICGGECCKGDSETGMLLFPFEESSFNIIEKDGVRLCVCDGRCNRHERPLSCRIFPFFPYVTPEGKIKVIPDIRGVNVCPLVSDFNNVTFDRGFLYRVKKVGRLLYADEECRKFLVETSREIDRILSLMEL